MKGNNLGGYEFLTFRYDGKMLFSVKIFNPSVVKREAPLFLATVLANGVGQGRSRKRPVTSRNLYRYKLGKIIMIRICIGISYRK